MGPPGGQVQSYIRYGHGIDSTQEVLQLSLDLGFIDRSGAWFSCPFLETNKELAKEVDPDVDVEDAEKEFITKCTHEANPNRSKINKDVVGLVKKTYTRKTKTDKQCKKEFYATQ